MELDGLLAFLDGTVEVRLSQLTAALVANRIERDDLRVVVLVALLLFQRTVDIGQRAIIIGIVARSERMPPTGLGGVFLRGATHKDGCSQQQKENDMSCLECQCCKK